MKIVPMAAEHGEDVISIFNNEITNGWAAFPEHPLPNAAIAMIFKMTENYPSKVILTDEGKVVGFGFLRAYNAIPVFRRSAEISYFLSPQVQRMGLGSSLLQQLENEAKQGGVRKLIATISTKNTTSIAFHIKNGFKQCGLLTDIGERKGDLFSAALFEKEI